MKDPNFAPVYAAMYTGLTEIVRKHGYALAVHGSMARDFDVVCIPWIEDPSPPEDVVKAICCDYALSQVGNPEIKHHGRRVYTLSVEFGDCFLDLSFVPTKKSWTDQSIIDTATWASPSGLSQIMRFMREHEYINETEPPSS